MPKRYDIEHIKAALLVWRVLEMHGIPTRRGRARCPIPGPCTGKAGEALSISADGCKWTCHRCHSGGTVLDLLAALEGLSIGEAIGRAAALAGCMPLAPGQSPPPRPRDPAREYRELVGKRWRSGVWLRDRLEALAIDETVPDDIRLKAMVGAVKATRRLDQMLGQVGVAS